MVEYEITKKGRGFSGGRMLPKTASQKITLSQGYVKPCNAESGAKIVVAIDFKLGVHWVDIRRPSTKQRNDEMQIFSGSCIGHVLKESFFKQCAS